MDIITNIIDEIINNSFSLYLLYSLLSKNINKEITSGKNLDIKLPNFFSSPKKLVIILTSLWSVYFWKKMFLPNVNWIIESKEIIIKSKTIDIVKNFNNSWFELKRYKIIKVKKINLK